MTPIQTKQCKTCGQVKPITEFYYTPERRDGYYYRCKICDRAAESSRRVARHAASQSLASRQRELLGSLACGYCGKRLYPKKGKRMMMLCQKHRPRPTSKPDVCHSCPLLLQCSERVRLRAWAYCERPDRRDLYRLAGFVSLMPTLSEYQHLAIATAIKRAGAEREWKELTQVQSNAANL